MLLLRIVLTAVLFLLLDQALPQYFVLFGGLKAALILAVLFLVLQTIVRPILSLITLPLRLLFSLPLLILINLVLLSLLYRASFFLDPTLLSFEILGGIQGWIVMSSLLGVIHWITEMVRGK
jgi:uncharacterized membrane protein YvlD (DUF360 family)